MSNVPFIFIHLGTEFFPEYVNTALEQCRRWNPTNPIYFVSLRIHSGKADTNKCTNICIEDLEITEQHSIFLNISKLDMTFRNGFWKYTTERIFVLEEVCNYLNIDEFFHAENDNMIYFNSSDLINTFRNSVNGLSSPSLATNQAVFGFMYCNDIQTLSNLAKFLITTDCNEMVSGARFFNIYNTKTAYLPSIPDIANILSERDKQRVCRNIEEFNGIFDPAQYGQWFGGIDSRNGNSVPFMFSNTCATIQANEFTYEKKQEATGLNRYYICKEGVSYPIYVLHIHSKNLSIFK